MTGDKYQAYFRHRDTGREFPICPCLFDSASRAKIHGGADANLPEMVRDSGWRGDVVAVLVGSEPTVHNKAGMDIITACVKAGAPWGATVPPAVPRK